MDWQVMSTMYPTFEIKHGIETITAANGESDITMTTSEDVFSNATLWSEAYIYAPVMTWNGFLRGQKAAASTTKIKFGLHMYNGSGATNQWQIHWVAFGY